LLREGAGESSVATRLTSAPGSPSCSSPSLLLFTLNPSYCTMVSLALSDASPRSHTRSLLPPGQLRRLARSLVPLPPSSSNLGRIPLLDPLSGQRCLDPHPAPHRSRPEWSAPAPGWAAPRWDRAVLVVGWTGRGGLCAHAGAAARRSEHAGGSWRVSVVVGSEVERWSARSGWAALAERPRAPIGPVLTLSSSTMPAVVRCRRPPYLPRGLPVAQARQECVLVSPSPSSFRPAC